jgi:hypothetical protein
MIFRISKNLMESFDQDENDCNKIFNLRFRIYICKFSTILAKSIIIVYKFLLILNYKDYYAFFKMIRYYDKIKK